MFVLSKYSQKCCNLFDDMNRIVKKKTAKIIIKKNADAVSQNFLSVTHPIASRRVRVAQQLKSDY